MPTTTEEMPGTVAPDARNGPGAVPTVPPAGPAWFASVMGTGILATLLGRESSGLPVLLVPAAALLALGTLLLVGLGAAFAARVVRDRSALTQTLRDHAILPTWGTVAMGILSIGSAAVTVLPLLGARTVVGGPAAWVVAVDAACWAVGTALGVVTALGFAAVVLTRDVGRPLPAWGLPLVPPMVSATTGAALVPQLHTVAARGALLVATVACFVLALVLGGAVFALAYRHHYRVAPLPVAASASAWIPLGMVGQSMAAAQAIATQAAPLLTPATARVAGSLAHTYGYVMLAVSLPVAMHALSMTVRGFRARMAFAPGWWALTFPIGTLALGTRLLGESTGHTLIGGVGLGALVVLCCTWCFCAATSVRAVRAVRATASHRRRACGGGACELVTADR